VLGADITAGGGPLLRYFDQRCKAVLGHSLREDDEDLWNRLDDLREARNKVAHEGTEPAFEEAERHAATAMDIFVWLDSISGT
jgi:hypothetical protein